MFNYRLQTAKLPQSLKQAYFIPLYKKNDPSMASNYRPVSLLSTIAKIFEKIIFKHLYNHLLENTIITPFQSGFLPGFSTQSQLIEIYHT
jgi:hypothetical protein